jgi:hypothetical protein
MYTLIHDLQRVAMVVGVFEICANVLGALYI